MNLYATDTGTFDAEAEGVGRLFATHAAVALADAQKIEQLEQAIGTRDVIGQAKGILMERFRIGPDEAFRLLAKASQNRHLKLRDVAVQVAETGVDPDDVSANA